MHRQWGVYSHRAERSTHFLQTSRYLRVGHGSCEGSEWYGRGIVDDGEGVVKAKCRQAYVSVGGGALLFPLPLLLHR